MIDPAIHIPRLEAIGHRHGFVLQSKEAPRANGKITYRCPRGHDVVVARDTALYSDWKGQCESCQFEDRYALLQTIVKRHGGKILSKERRLRTTDNVRLQCAAGHQWQKQVYSLIEGTWCGRCLAEARRTSLDDANALAKPYGGRCVSNECNSASDPLLWECSEGHQWTRNYQEQKKQRVFCSICRIPTGRAEPEKLSLEQKRQRSFDRIKEIAASKGGRCLSTTFKNQLEPLQWECAEGHRWTAPAQPIVHYGAWCRVCAQLARGNAITLESLQAHAARHGGKVLSKEYRKNTDKIHWQCNSGHTFARSWMAMRKAKYFCPKCR